MLNEFKKSMQVKPKSNSEEVKDIGTYENFNKIIKNESIEKKDSIKDGLKNINPEFNENR